MTEHFHLDEPFALQKIMIDRAMLLLKELAHWRTSPLPERQRAICARMVYRLSKLRRLLDQYPDELTDRRAEEDARGETDLPYSPLTP